MNGKSLVSRTFQRQLWDLRQYEMTQRIGRDWEPEARGMTFQVWAAA